MERSKMTNVTDRFSLVQHFVHTASRGAGGRLELQGRVHERPGNGRRVVAGTGRAPTQPVQPVQPIVQGSSLSEAIATVNVHEAAENGHAVV